MTFRQTIKTGLSLALAGGCLLSGGWFTSSNAWTVTEEAVREQVMAHAKAKLGNLLSKDDLQYMTVDVLKVPAAPFDFPDAQKAGDVKIEAESVLDEFYSERAVVRVHMASADGKTRDIGVPVQILVKKPVWIVKNQINANQPIGISDLKLEVRNVSRTYGYAVGRERNLAPYIARVNLRPGEMLDARKIVIPPDITCNSEIRIFMSNGNGMTLSVPGIALANGRIGETIRVRQALNQRKYYQAKIIDKNRVLVEI